MGETGKGELIRGESWKVHDNIEYEIYVMYLTCQGAAILKIRCHQGQLCNNAL